MKESPNMKRTFIVFLTLSMMVLVPQLLASFACQLF